MPHPPDVYPKPVDTGDLCDCGRPKAPGDFLCDKCRARLEREKRELQREIFATWERRDANGK